MTREELLQRATAGETWDVVVIGGGATGLGVAVDAASRGWRTLLLEQDDLGKGTSSRSSKLIHGGLRYLKQGNISLVREALRERGILYTNAPHLVTNLAFVVPRYKWWEGPFYGIGLKLYDVLAGKLNLARSRSLGRRETLAKIPNLERDGLDGATMYHDGQFDDARMCVSLALTALDHDGVILTRARVTAMAKDEGDPGQVRGVRFVDVETGAEHEVSARVVINATGVFADAIRQMDEPDAPSILEPSRGVHLVLDASFLDGDTAIAVPQTDDGRVLFVIPWHDRCLVGTTDAGAPEPVLEPRASDEEVGFILRNASRYLARDPKRADVLSVFAGLRPLVNAGGGGADTKSISREHEIITSPSGLVSIVGGKWTTYRRMAEEVLEVAADVGDLAPADCRTETLHLHGYLARDDAAMPEDDTFRFYGADAPAVHEVCGERSEWLEPLDDRLPYPTGLVAWSARREMARTVEDVLSRRTRALLLDARASIAAAPRVARVLADELGRDEAWVAAQVAEYEELARGYLLPDGDGPGDEPGDAPNATGAAPSDA